MNSYFLKNYKLSKLEMFKSSFASEYGLRHFDEAKQPQLKWGHRIIGIIELCPLIRFNSHDN